MNLVSYALFENESHARAAQSAIEASLTPSKRAAFGAVLHHGRLDDGKLGLLETGASEGLREGAAIGGVLGILAGFVEFGVVSLSAVGGTAILGVVYGAIAGALAGSSAPDRRLEKMSKQLADGKTLLTIETPDERSREFADSVMRNNGGHVEHKQFF